MTTTAELVRGNASQLAAYRTVLESIITEQSTPGASPGDYLKAEARVLDGRRVPVSTRVRSHVPFPPEGGSVPLPCGRVARHPSPPDAGTAA